MLLRFCQSIIKSLPIIFHELQNFKYFLPSIPPSNVYRAHVTSSVLFHVFCQSKFSLIRNFFREGINFLYYKTCLIILTLRSQVSSIEYQLSLKVSFNSGSLSTNGTQPIFKILMTFQIFPRINILWVADPYYFLTFSMYITLQRFCLMTVEQYVLGLHLIPEERNTIRVSSEVTLS